MQPFTARVIEIIQSIPEGKVMTYGQVASLAGSPRAARQVVRILHSMSEKYNLPWHRVVNKQGEISMSDEWHRSLQQSLLESEGIELDLSKRIDLTRYQA